MLAHARESPKEAFLNQIPAGCHVTFSLVLYWLKTQWVRVCCHEPSEHSLLSVPVRQRDTHTCSQWHIACTHAHRHTLCAARQTICKHARYWECHIPSSSMQCAVKVALTHHLVVSVTLTHVHTTQCASWQGAKESLVNGLARPYTLKAPWLSQTPELLVYDAWSWCVTPTDTLTSMSWLHHTGISYPAQLRNFFLFFCRQLHSAKNTFSRHIKARTSCIYYRFRLLQVVKMSRTKAFQCICTCHKWLINWKLADRWQHPEGDSHCCQSLYLYIASLYPGDQGLYHPGDSTDPTTGAG